MVSVLFTDLVGSTATASRLGPVAAEASRSDHFGLLRDAVSSTGGTEVKNLGDGLMVVYANVGNSLDGAVAMQQGVERYNRKARVPLRPAAGAEPHVPPDVGAGDARSRPRGLGRGPGTRRATR